MKNIIIEPKEKIAVLRLARGVTNAINPALVSECTEALQLIQQQYQGLVLTGGAKFLSIGLDLPALLPFNRTEMITFWRQFDRMLLKLYTLPMPTACVVSGHATAGGTILAISCDFRYISPGKRLMGLNEIKIGIPVPYLADLILRQVVGDRVATEMTYTGEFVDPDQAAARGLVDEIFSETDVETKAVEKVTAIATRVKEAFAFTKQSRVEEVERRFGQYAESRLDRFLGCWFQPDVQELLHRAADKF
ncbi:MAG: enoyl-CoA hydratase/isomerase family protein [Thermodesulfobacteriota bacterium]|nr:enoyl-CoA hydratase/isomerase family protein [Thermodesulfobacteriota bacterium]